ncbi:MAG: hypothetical protein ABIS50_07155 [Luteolibacter sp.]|uniref:hypothetical protein n=1 Tax=Luteolibacter sp. TaxID=1962973 RepID=UPI00326344A9
MKSSLLAACGLFLLGAGIGIGWLAASSRNGNPPSAATGQANPSRTSSRPRPAAADEAPLTHLRALADDPHRLEAEMKDLPAKDLAALIDMLAASAGIGGLEGKERERIKNLVIHNYEEFPEDSLAWIMATPNAGNRRFYFQCVFESAVKKDPMQALELGEKYRGNTGDYVSLPVEIFSAVTQRGADTLVRALALTAGKRDNSSGYDLDYPKDFNFKAAAAGISDLSSRMKEGEQFSTYPANFVLAWVKQDAQAAYEWATAMEASEDNRKALVGGLSDFFEGYVKVTEPLEYGRFAAEATLSGEPTEKSWYDATSALARNPDPATIDAFLAEASTHRDSGEILPKLLDASKSFYGNQIDILRNGLFDRLPEEQRAQYLLTAPEAVRRQLGAEPAK